MFGKILFATDFSAYAKSVLDCIAGFPGAREVILVHIINEVHSPRGGGEIGGELFRGGENNLLREEKRRLENLSQTIRVTTVAKISSNTAGAIIDTAKEMGASLIVIGARGKSLVEGVLLGSVSRTVLRRSRTNVLIMRHMITRDMKGETFHKFCPGILSRVLCPTDFSEYSEKAITFASRMTGIREVILLHIVSQGETEVEIKDALQKAETRLGEIRNGFAAQGINVRAIVKTGSPPHEITRIADEEDVSVIWMNSFGKGWFRDLLLGSTASTVAMNAKQPVLIIRTMEGV